MTIPKISTGDYLRDFLQEVPASEHPAVQRQYETHEDRLRLLAQFKQIWNEQLGHLFEVPDDDQLFRWFKISKWDFQLLCMSIEDLQSRSEHPMGPHDVYGHAIRHFSASLVRRVRGRYGLPPERKEAA